MACTSCKKKNSLPEKVVNNVESQGEFKLRSNVGVIQLEFGSGLFLSNSNMTDELAVQFLKENPNRISLFEKYPSNWKEILFPNEETDKPAKGKRTSRSK